MRQNIPNQIYSTCGCSHKQGKTFLNILVIIIFLVVGIFYIFVNARPIRSSHGGPLVREKACYANMRVLLGAVEMYNMDNDVMIKHMDNKAISLLVKGKYLRKDPQKPTSSCEYLDDGDLTNGGLIRCREHGTVEGPPPPPPTISDRILKFLGIM